MRRSVPVLLALALLAPTGVGATEEPQLCEVATDDSPDGRSVLSTRERDPATDIAAIRLGTDDTTLYVELEVADLPGDMPDDVYKQWWAVSWNDDEEDATATRYQDGSWSFHYNSGGPRSDDPGEPTAGSVDPAADTIRIEVPREELSITDGRRLTHVHAVEVEYREPLIPGHRPYSYGDIAPDVPFQYLVGVPCAEQDTALCPVALDPSGDVRTGLYPGPGVSPDPSLDIRSTGARTDGDTLILSATLEAVFDAPPLFAALAGWTISWWDGETRWYGQAAWTPDGEVRFTYGEDSGARAEARTTFRPDGMPTTGELDRENDVVRIKVPREGVGNPFDDVRLAGFLATSWANPLPTRNPALYVDMLPADRTDWGRYRVGVDCRA